MISFLRYYDVLLHFKLGSLDHKVHSIVDANSVVVWQNTLEKFATAGVGDMVCQDAADCGGTPMGWSL